MIHSNLNLAPTGPAQPTPTVPALPLQLVGTSWDVRAYQGYVRMCDRVGVDPASYEVWYMISGKLESAVKLRGELNFHGYALGDHNNGSWDNAVRTLEEAA